MSETVARVAALAANKPGLFARLADRFFGKNRG